MNITVSRTDNLELLKQIRAREKEIAVLDLRINALEREQNAILRNIDTIFEILDGAEV